MSRPVLFLDISRLVRRYEHFGGPTGIDRIEMTYARWLFEQSDFTPQAVTRWRERLVALDERAARHVVDALSARWSTEAPRQFGRRGRPAIQFAAERVRGRLAVWHLLRGARALDTGGARSVTLNVGHDGLDQPQRFARLPGPFAALLHDVIPLTHPEYDSRRAEALHRRRIATLARHARHVFTVSEATRQALLAACPHAPFTSSTVHNAPGLSPPAAPTAFARPTFVHLSSIDRRKNLPLLLHVWRELSAEPDPPDLMIIGRRGNDATALELIDRCPALAGHVTATGGLGDGEVARHLAGARALLTPSFVEGFGMPVVEAHLMGVPVIASDIAAHREIGGASTTYLSPLDGPAWREAILAYARDDALRAARAAAIAPPPTWRAHLAAVADTLDALAARTPGP